MRASRKLTFQLTEDEAIQLASELDDLGFGSDDGSGEKQSDELWPILAEISEQLEGLA